jgi:hypothetical protein
MMTVWNPQLGRPGPIDDTGRGTISGQRTAAGIAKADEARRQKEAEEKRRREQAARQRRR